MCSDAHDAVCHGNNLSGGFSDPNTPRRAGELHRRAVRRRPVPQARDPGDRDVAGVQGRRPDRHHVRRGLPAVHLHRQQLRELDASSRRTRPRRSRTASAAETLFGRRVHFEPTGPNTPLAKDAHGNELYPGPGFNSYIDRPSNCVAQTIPRLPAGDLHPRRRSNVPGARPDAASDGRGGELDDRRQRGGRDRPGTLGDRHRDPGGRVRRQGHRHADQRDRSERERRLRRHRLVHARGQLRQAALRTTAAVSGVVLGARTPATDPLYDATGRDRPAAETPAAC